MARRKRKRRVEPVSPGEILQEEFLKPMGLTQSQLARHIGCDVKVVNRIVNGHTRITPSMACKLAGSFGTTAQFWLNLQMNQDVWQVQNSTSDFPSLLLPSRA